jgi:hypothetical protein
MGAENHPAKDDAARLRLAEAETGSDTFGVPKKDNQDQRGGAAKSGAAWKTALLLGGSVVLGAMALALWNRRTLAKFQDQLKP